jgi:hypothetical protein
MNEQKQAYLKNWASILTDNTERDLSKEAFKSMLLNSRSWDIFSSWILLISGATFTLIIPNLELLKNLMSLVNIKFFLLLLLGSSVFGVIAKYFSTAIEVLLNITIAVEGQFLQILNRFETEKTKIENSAKQDNLEINVEIDIKRVVQPIINQFPKFYHRFLWKALEAGKKDLLINYKKATKYTLIRGCCITIQIAFFIIAVLIFAVNIKNL